MVMSAGGSVGRGKGVGSSVEVGKVVGSSVGAEVTVGSGGGSVGSGADSGVEPVGPQAESTSAITSTATKEKEWVFILFSLVFIRLYC
jgi:hypothetical protein